MPPPTRSAADEALINQLPYSVLMEFRNEVFTSTHIAARPDKFLTSDWIDASELRSFLARTDRLPVETVIKKEPDAPAVLLPQIGRVIRENDKEVIDICASDSENEVDATNSAKAALTTAGSVVTPGRRRTVSMEEEDESATQKRPMPSVDSRDIWELSPASTPTHAASTSSATSRSGGGTSPAPASSSPCAQAQDRQRRRVTMESVEDEMDVESDGDFLSSDVERILEPAIRAPAGHRSPQFFNSYDNWRVSDTNWGKEGLVSYYRDVDLRVTAQRSVKRIEYLFEYPPYFPIPHPEHDTAYIIDADFALFDYLDKHGIRYTVDANLKNHDNDSWKGTTGSADTFVLVTFGEGEPPVLCRRSRLRCKGGFACCFVDSDFVNVERRYLDPTIRSAVFAAQRKARSSAGTTEERRVAEAVTAIRGKKCTARDSTGNICTGVPVMRQRPGEPAPGGNWYIDCSKRSVEFNAGHLAQSIDVDQDLFLLAFHGLPMAGDASKDTEPCGGVIHPTSGKKARKPHTHIINGISRDATVVDYPCPAERTIYVPVDPRIRKAMLVHNAHQPHSHVLPAFTKKTHEATSKYEDLIHAVGPTGATAAKVDKAAPMILGGKTPAEVAPALQSKVLKNKILREVKKQVYPAGLGLEGALHLHCQDANLDPDERYVHRFVTMGNDGTIILTAVAGLVKLLDDPAVNCFEADVTFKRTNGEWNEFEVSTYYKPLDRAITLARAYINRASANFFERVCDELGALKLELTGKPIAFKALVPGGNLVAFNSDMDSAQVLGAARSFLKTNVESHSGIPANTPAEIAAPRFIKLCTTHAKRAILDFRSLVSPSDFHRLLNFDTVITSRDSLAEFAQFVRGLGIKKIQDWWDHKHMSDWILPCLVKSLSPMPANDWDSTASTTNTGEAQHHWTNTQTGTKLPLVEAMETARTVDLRVWAEVQLAIKSGILTNPYNGATQRLARSMTRRATTANKYREARIRTEAAQDLEEELEAAQREQKAAADRIKELRAQKAAGKTKGKGRKKAQQLAGDSSSGRVKSRGKASTSTLKTTNDSDAPTLPLSSPDPAPAAPAPLPALFPGVLPELAADYIALPFNNADSMDLFPTGNEQGLTDKDFDRLLASVTIPDADILMQDAWVNFGSGHAAGDGNNIEFAPSPTFYLPMPRSSPSPPPLLPMALPLQSVVQPVHNPLSRKRKTPEVDVNLILSPRVTRPRKKTARAEAAEAAARDDVAA